MIERAKNPAKRGASTSRRGFTLVELLVVMGIVATLSVVMIAAMRGSDTMARRRATQALITRLNTALQQRYESYHTRRIPVANLASVVNTYRSSGVLPNISGAVQRYELDYVRLVCLRHLMRVEMPDNWDDVYGTGLGFVPGTSVAMPSALAQAYQYRAIVGGSTPSATDSFQRAECLYLVVMMGSEEESDEFDSWQRHTGDKDGDGRPEFHDAWGNPILFLRWAPGYFASLPETQADLLTATTTLDAPNSIHDPFDPQRVDKDGFELFPLIYSAGPDGIYDINVSGFTFNAPPSPLQYCDLNFNSSPASSGRCLDYYWQDGPRPRQAGLMGTPTDIAPAGNDANGRLDHYDNIFNVYGFQAVR
jgi:prepilin-type N-terminal cleavage/methylation domain-containing protein